MLERIRVFAGLALCAGLATSCFHIRGSIFDSHGWDASALRTDQHALDLGPGDTLRLVSSDGSLQLSTTDGVPGLTAMVTAWGDTDAEAEGRLAAAEVVIERDGDRIEVRVEAGDGPIDFDETWIAADFHVEVPAGLRVVVATRSGDISVEGAFAHCDARTGYGSVTVSGVRGDVAARSQSGDVRVEDSRGETVGAHSSYGDITLAAVEAGKVEAVSSSGDVRLSEVTCEGARAETAYGDVDVGAHSGSLVARSSSGSIEVVGARDGAYQLTTDYGDVVVHDAVGALGAHTSSGSVDVEDFDGSAKASSGYGDVDLVGRCDVVEARSSSGDVRVVATAGSSMADGWELWSSYGDLELHLPGDMAFALRAQTGYGRIHSDFPVLTDSGLHLDKRLHGSVNGGGATLRLETSSGDVELRRSPTDR